MRFSTTIALCAGLILCMNTTQEVSAVWYGACSEVRHIATQGNYVWAGTNSGLIRLDTETDSIRVFSTKDGLGSNSITALAVDRDDNVWVSTSKGGISRFDGSTWVTYDSSDGLLASYYRYFAFASDGTVWAAGPGVSYFDGIRWHSFDKTNGLIDCKIALDKNDVPWVSTGFNSHSDSPVSHISYFDGENWIVIQSPESPPLYTVHQLFFDDDGYLNIFVYGHKWLRYHGTTWETVFDLIDMSYVKKILDGHDGTFWFATSDGVKWYDGSEWGSLPETPLYDNNTWCIARQDNGNIWVGHWIDKGGFAGFDGTSWKYYNVTDGIAHDDVRSLTLGHDGSLWAATEYGISHFNNEFWQTYTVEDGLHDNDITHLTTGPDGRIWAAGSERVSYFDGNGWNTIEMYEFDTPYQFGAMAVDSENNLWLGLTHSIQDRDEIYNWGIVAKYDGMNWDVSEFHRNDDINNINDITIAPNGDVWVSTGSYALQKTGTGWNVFPVEEIDPRFQSSLGSIVAGPDNRIWLSIHPAGVFCYDNGHWSMVDSPRRPGDDVWYGLYVKDITVDANNSIWIVCDGGELFSLDGNQFTEYICDYEYSYPLIQTIVSDVTGIYFSSKKGVYYFGGLDTSFNKIPVIETKNTSLAVEEFATNNEVDTSLAFPNPFNAATTIRYSIPSHSPVSIAIYNSSGQKISNYDLGELGAGNHEYIFQGSELPSGVYFYRIDQGTSSITGRMLLMK